MDVGAGCAHKMPPPRQCVLIRSDYARGVGGANLSGRLPYWPPLLRRPTQMRIACPKCTWEPTASDRWACSCGHVWNTFDTAGQCPRCRHVWHETVCLACKRWSKHHDWYHDLPPVDALLDHAPAVHGE